MTVVELIISRIAPHRCTYCLSDKGPLCKECLPLFPEQLVSRCVHCNSLSSDFKVCQTCRSKTALRHVWSATNYHEAAKAAIHDYKFERLRAWHQPFGELMAQVVPYSDFDLITYVPTAPRRVRQRGYDQAALLAKTVAKNLNVPVVPLLIHGGQHRQVGVGRAQRFAQAYTDYHLRPKAEAVIKNKRILLVDDVVTTSATLSACANLLKAGGAKSIDGLTLARRA